MRPRRVLVFFNEIKIGTSIASIPAVKAVIRHFGPAMEIWLLCREEQDRRTVLLDIPFAGGGIKGHIPMPAWRDLSALFSAILRIRRLKFSHAVYVGNSTITPKRMNRYRLLMMACGIKNLIGFHRCLPHDATVAHSGASCPIKSQMVLRLENLAEDGIETFVDSDCSSPLFDVPEQLRRSALAWLRTNRSMPERPLVAICPGAAAAANLWPIDRFIEIGKRLIKLDRFEIAVCGGSHERTVGDRMVEEWGEGLNAAGQLSVLGSAVLMQECRFLLGLDTGTTHLAGAVGTPCVVLQGGRMPAGAWDPPGIGHVILRHPVNCVGCRKTTCVISRHPCMRGLTVDKVWSSILRMPQLAEIL